MSESGHKINVNIPRRSGGRRGASWASHPEAAQQIVPEPGKAGSEYRPVPLTKSLAELIPLMVDQVRKQPFSCMAFNKQTGIAGVIVPLKGRAVAH